MDNTLQNLTLITHTHTDCSDVWIPYFDSYKTFFNHKNHIVLVNETTNKIDLKQCTYNTHIQFSDRILDVIRKLDTQYVLISLEDMILYDYVDIKKMTEVVKFASVFGANFIRLIKSGIQSNSHIQNNLYKIEQQDWLFSITPTIWNKAFLTRVLERVKNMNIWNLEIEASNYLKPENINAYYWYDNESRVGDHFNSSIYPHICSAIYKGKWNTSEYPIIKEIANKYNINLNERGER